MPAQRPNPVRRPHSKSRTGCRICKARRVKCDETRPSCRRCQTHGAQCDFLFEADSTTPRGRQDSGSRDALSIHQLTSPSVSSTPDAARYPTTWFSVCELELFHHFITSTSLTLACDPVARDFWRVNVPQLGFLHPYVLKGVLSIAALHLARLRPQQKDSLVEQAMMHHTAASSMALPLITNASGENFPPIFHFSMLTTIITFARPRAPDNFLLVSDGILPDWLLISRGVRTLLQSEGDAVLSMSSLDALFYAAHNVPELCDGILTLRRCFNLFYTSGFSEEERMRSALMWLVKIPDPFVELLKGHDSGALCVLAFFCVLLKRLEYLWWIEGWAFHLIERIYSTLDERYRLWIRWPLEEIGWAP
ncbi:putative c6 transcription protein [Rosellinia necatrix]|uniref:Putative c6 transcription protein n=1 Tax=Rosellinia necatrix TaxID=77044 RepID=A0A1S7UNK7_ROSNE|nr:putative c6 transcription protein [Rosellinia necatrix]